MSINRFESIPFPKYPLNNVTPFTYRDGLTYVQLLEEIRSYINNDLIGILNGLIDDLNSNNELRITEMQTIFQSVLDQTSVALDTLTNNYLGKEVEMDAAIANMTANFNTQKAEVESQFAALSASQTASFGDLVSDHDAQEAALAALVVSYTNTLDDMVAQMDSITASNNMLSSVLLNSFKWNVNANRIDLTDQSTYDSFPTAVLTDDNELVVLWSSQPDHVTSGDAKVRVSTNLGVTFSTPFTVAAGHGAVGLATFKGRVACLTITREPYIKPWVQITDTPSVAASYSPLIDISAGLYATWRFGSSIVWLDDGTVDGLILVTSYGDEGVSITASTDGGVTWTHRSQPSTLPWTGGNPNETWIVQAANGFDLVMLVRNDMVGNNHITVRRSTDWGFTWTAPQLAFSEASGLPSATLLPDGRLVALFRDARADSSPSSWGIAYSIDNGYTWVKEYINNEKMMYGQVVPVSLAKALLVGGSELSSTTSVVWYRVLNLIAKGVDYPTPYTPIWRNGSDNTNLYVVDGSIVGESWKIGGMRFGNVVLTRGSNTNIGTSHYSFTLPTTPRTRLMVTGSGVVNDTIPVNVFCVGGDTVVLISPTGRIGSANPGDNSAGKRIQFSFTYPEN